MREAHSTHTHPPTKLSLIIMVNDGSQWGHIVEHDQPSTPRGRRAPLPPTPGPRQAEGSSQATGGPHAGPARPPSQLTGGAAGQGPRPTATGNLDLNSGPSHVPWCPSVSTAHVAKHENHSPVPCREELANAPGSHLLPGEASRITTPATPPPQALPAAQESLQGSRKAP